MNIIVETPACPGCGKIQRIEVSEEGLDKWKTGTLIHKALSGLSRDKREALMTGYCEKCWDELWRE